jgi:hypothetical protein
MLGLFLANATRFDCSPAKATLPGVTHPVRWLSSGQLPFAKNDNLQHKVPKTKRVAGYPETSGHRQLFCIV